MERKEIYNRLNKEFKRLEEKLLATKQPWHYYRLAIAYEVCELVDTDLELEDDVLEALEYNDLGDIVDKVIDSIEERDQNIWSVAIDVLGLM